MSFAITPEQEELRAVVRQFLTRKAPSAQVRRLMETEDGFDAVLWKELAGLGVHGLAIPEVYGGAGFSTLELVIVLEEMGRALLVAPFFSTTALAAPLLLAAGDEEAKQRWLPAIADGTLRATVALSEAGRSDDPWSLDAVSTRATTTDGGRRLDGEKDLVVDGAQAELLLVVARDAEGLGVYAVEGGAPGLTRTSLETLDPTRKLARVRLGGTPGRRIGEGDATAAVTHALDVAAACLAAEQTGAAGWCLDEAVGYAKVREQFGRPIGAFQVIKHMCADMLMLVESARSAAYLAAWSADEEPGELPRTAAVAQAYCSEAFAEVAAATIQVHGGIGVTWEHDAHLYFRRATASRVLLGEPSQHRARLAGLAGI